MKKIYVDITESYAWTGKVTGIIRVMDELASRFDSSDMHETQLIVWNKKYSKFLKVDFVEVQANRKRNEKNVPSKIDIEIDDYSTPASIAGVKVPFSRSIKRVLAYPKNKASKENLLRNEVIFEDDSVLFMPHGGVWGVHAYLKTIADLKKTKNVSLVPILYDLSPVLLPQFCSEGVRKTFSSHMREALVTADLVIAISQNTANDAKSWLRSLGLGEINAIETIRLGDEVLKGDNKQPQETKLPSEFILCVGTIEARKNHASLYYAYKLAEQKNVELPPVVVVGRKGWLADDVYDIIANDPYTKGKFIFLHLSDDKQLSWLYENALFSVYPSFYEGWGLPIAESLVHGLPCITSNTSSMPEIGGELVDYCSPYSPEDLMNKMYQLYDNPELLKSKRKLIQAKYKSTSWDDSFNEVCDLLSKL